VNLIHRNLPMASAVAEQCRISVIVPVLNEAGYIERTLEALQDLRRRGHEVIVVDGGSQDASVALSRPLADVVVKSVAGRAVQMQAGAAIAKGNILWFLHADTVAHRQADQLIIDAVMNTGRLWGRFDVRFPDGGPLLKGIAFMMNMRSRLTGIATGDQGIFVLRPLFECVSGFPPIPLMEDIALSRTLKRYSRPAALRDTVASSARRWNNHGVIGTVIMMWGLRLAYFLGVPPKYLAGFYAVNRT